MLVLKPFLLLFKRLALIIVIYKLYPSIPLKIEFYAMYCVSFENFRSLKKTGPDFVPPWGKNAKISSPGDLHFFMKLSTTLKVQEIRLFFPLTEPDTQP